MKSTNILLPLLFAASLFGPACAAEGTVNCSSLANTAEQVMSIRQDNGDMEQVMEIAKGNNLAKLMVRQAYEHPRFSTSDNQKQAVQDFRNMWYLACTKAHNKN